jgi:hypothetical protein
MHAYRPPPQPLAAPALCAAASVFDSLCRLWCSPNAQRASVLLGKAAHYRLLVVLILSLGGVCCPAVWCSMSCCLVLPGAERTSVLLGKAAH